MAPITGPFFMSSGGPDLSGFTSAAAQLGVKPVQAPTMLSAFSGWFKGPYGKNEQIKLVRANMDDFRRVWSGHEWIGCGLHEQSVL